MYEYNIRVCEQRSRTIQKALLQFYKVLIVSRSSRVGFKKLIVAKPLLDMTDNAVRPPWLDQKYITSARRPIATSKRVVRHRNCAMSHFWLVIELYMFHSLFPKTFQLGRALLLHCRQRNCELVYVF